MKDFMLSVFKELPFAVCFYYCISIGNSYSKLVQESKTVEIECSYRLVSNLRFILAAIVVLTWNFSFYFR